MVLKIRIWTGVHKRTGYATYMPEDAVRVAADDAGSWTATFRDMECLTGDDLSQKLSNEIASSKPDALILDFGPLGDDPSNTVAILEAVKGVVSGIQVLIVARKESNSLLAAMATASIFPVLLRPDGPSEHLSGLLHYMSNQFDEQDSDVYVM